MNISFSWGSLLCCALLLALGLGALAWSAEPADIDKLPANPDLPDPLLQLDGSRIEDVAGWESKRKPELKQLFQHYMYGYFPPPAPVTASIIRSDSDGLGGKATITQVNLSFGKPDAPSIDLLLVVPNGAAKPSPVVLGLNFTGNHAVLADPRVALARGWMRPGPGVVDNQATEASRGTGIGQWEIEHSIDRGYAVATFYHGDIVPDKPDGRAAFLNAFPAEGKDASSAETSSTTCGAIGAWAWGLQRAVDYLIASPAIDAKRVIVYGHSRNGKAALVAGAFDDRIAAVIPHQAGCGGTAPNRCHNPKGETMTVINQRFPYWFDDEYKKFNEQADRLPFDQHELIALCFPRPVLLTNGTQDQWADPPGQLEVLKGADKVYRALGVPGIDPAAVAENDQLIGERLCYFIREAPHSIDKVYWDVFLDFADRSLPGGK